MMSRNIFTYFQTYFSPNLRALFSQTKKNKLWPFYLKGYFVKTFTRCKSKQEECRRKDKCCLSRLPLKYLTPEKLFKSINYTMS